MLGRFQAALAAGKLEHACSILESTAVSGGSRVKDTSARTCFDTDDVFNIVRETLTVSGSAAFDKEFHRRLLVAVERLCGVLWMRRVQGDEERLLGIRYTLIRRLVSLDENEKVLDHSWALLKDLLDGNSNSTVVLTVECVTEICTRRRFQKPFVTMTIGAFLLFSAALANALLSGECEVQQLFSQFLIVMEPVLALVLGQNEESSRRHAQSFICYAVKMLSCLKGVGSHDDLYDVQHKTVVAIFCCLEQCTFEKSFVLSTCAKLVQHAKVSEASGPLLRLTQAYRLNGDENLATICLHVVRQAVRTSARSDGLAFFNQLCTSAMPWHVHALKVALRFTSATENSSVLSCELASVNVSFSKLLEERLCEARCAMLANVYVTLAQEIHEFCRNCIMKFASHELAREVQRCALIGADLVDHVSLVSFTSNSWLRLPDSCLTNALSAILLKSLSDGDVSASTNDSNWCTERDSLERLAFTDRLNTPTTRKAIHTLATRCYESGCLAATELLYTLNVHCCDRLTGLRVREMNANGERHGRISALVRFLWLSARRDDAINTLIQHSRHYGTPEMPYKLLLTLYFNTAMIDSTSFSLPSLGPRLFSARGCSIELTDMFVEECRFWNDSDLPIHFKHRLQCELLDFALEIFQEYEQKLPVAQNPVFMRLTRIVFQRPVNGVNSCPDSNCLICTRHELLRFYTLASSAIQRMNGTTAVFEAIRTAVLTELTCRTSLALISMNSEDSFETAYRLVQPLMVHNSRVSVVLECETDSPQRAAVLRALETVHDVLEMFNILGTTEFSSRFKSSLSPFAVSHVAAALLAPRTPPCLIRATPRCCPRVRDEWSERFDRGRSLLVLACIAAERMNLYESYAYIELAIPNLRDSLRSYPTWPNCASDELNQRYLKPSFYHVLGTYVSTLCTKALICVDLGMRSLSLSAFEEALELSKKTCSWALQGVIHLHRAHMYLRFDKLDECASELQKYERALECDLTKDFRNSSYDNKTEKYAAALAWFLRSSCSRDERTVLESHQNALSCTKEELPLNMSALGLCIDISKCDACASWRSPFSLLYAKLLCHEVVLQSDSKLEPIKLLCDLKNQSRVYQPLLKIFMAACDLRLKYVVHPQLRKITVLAPVACPSHSIDCFDGLDRDVRQKLSELSLRCRDVPVIQWEINSKVLNLAFSSGTTNTYEIVRAIHACYGAPFESQHLALLSVKMMRLHEHDSSFARAMYKLHSRSHEKFSAVTQASKALEVNAVRIAAPPQLEHCMHTNLLGVPIVTVGIFQPEGYNVLDDLFISRVCGTARSVLCVRLSYPSIRKVFQDFSDTVAHQHDVPESSFNRASKVNWWEKRILLDSKLQKLLNEIDSRILGPWRVLFLGHSTDHVEGLLRATANVICQELQRLALDLNMQTVQFALDFVCLLLNGLEMITDEEFAAALCSLIVPCVDHDPATPLCVSRGQTDGMLQNPRIVELVTQARRSLPGHKNPKTDSTQSAVLLALEDEARYVAWESIDSLRVQSFYRVPSVAVANTACASLQTSANKMDPASGFYVLNPGGDLAKTQSCLAPTLQLSGWPGISGMSPSARDIFTALASFDFYFYFGHGGGLDIVKHGMIGDVLIRSAIVLMGCSSGAYDPHDYSSPASVSMLCLLAGAPMIMANIWDVTDTDIDRLSTHLLQELLSFSRSMSAPQRTLCLSASLKSARRTCRLKFLNGAAPVIYGVPLPTR